jgi:hypothetical protein
MLRKLFTVTRCIYFTVILSFLTLSVLMVIMNYDFTELASNNIEYCYKCNVQIFLVPKEM